ncbi:hypothetical protein COEREDRAFT_17419 [Coemansia reversa NRRL 1564]|uniref:Peroxisome assembly protein 22 n=1 Tax=Coemansia reversa (strain ATCC 12441 / NRRL 1564) TaxID=763665 RepID=A0A2G5B3M1_COERN|nr:hypothetical protein COEREDRAFT_17419 [Coemansia reversa NRRL 1564]|eukprot:PIA13623.1 hypothetical protein COEREDRAFT_17419 [Coemansia reversa NRRL 1564]
MSRSWNKGRRGVVLAVSAAVLGLLGYLAYEVYQESTKDDDSDNQTADESDTNSDVEDVLFISEQTTSHQYSPDNRAIESRFLPHIGSIRSDIENKPCVAISARGIILDSKDPENKWSADVTVRKSAIPILLRLVELYRVYLIVVVSPVEADDGKQEQVLRALEDAGIVNSLQNQVYEEDRRTFISRDHRQYEGIGESVVWVNKEDSSDSSNPPSDVPSSQISAILNAPVSGPVSAGNTSPAILPRSHVLFCQTEEGKSHMARHLLTARPPVATNGSLGRSYAGYIDTNRSVIARLSQVLHTTVLLVTDDSTTESKSNFDTTVKDESNPQMLITYGDVPGAHTAFLPSEEYTDLTSHAHNIEIVQDITTSSLFQQIK